MMVNGGEDSLMARGFIKKLMVIKILIIGDLYAGNFKNGLKHGLGTENFGNGDYYKG